ncbi:serine/threonine-protein kinase [Roseospira goensis]|uniref:Protein kinase domain-containing protein n=1 Tax=Roseospira goensis TaxID=391922 RepID=A0A7W6RZU9_9PROT|nr:serine/threonine-protein kinase [Roseospira goensis]MBB4286280.1 hypothetical protein [Roseospira goensis]
MQQTSRTTTHAPETIGPYRVVGVLGQGAMGIVYAGIDARTGTAAAIKTVNRKEVSRLRQIRREIRALARLHHPGVVRILDHGVADGLPWYAMEHLDGTSLKDLLRRHWRDPAAPPRPAPVGDTTEDLTQDVTDAAGVATGATQVTDATDAADATQGADATLVADATDATDATQVIFPDGGPASDDGAITVQDPGAPPHAFGGGDADAPAADTPVRPRTRRAGGPAAAGHLGEGLSLLQRVCETLAFLHGEGIVHRDLKPGNIFIRHSGEPILADFGLAEEAGGATGREQIGETHQISGSPAYMSPEQLRGDALDARSDLYALGCILYQVLTGEAPFVGSQTQILSGHLERHAGPPSARVTGVPPTLDRLVDALLAKDRADRLGFAETVACALADLGTHPPVWSVPAPAAKPYLYRSSFVGRQDVLAALDEHLARARAGTGALALVAGESGAGKTRLALETGILARRRSLEVITGDCPAAGDGDGAARYGRGAPLQPLRPFVEALADRCIAGGPAEQARLLGDRAAVLAPYFPVLKTVPGVAALPAAPPLPSAAARDRLFRALADSLAAYLVDRALLLVLDDLQWADELTLGVLRHLLDEVLPGLPLLVVGAFRAEERTPALDALARDPAVDAHTLHRLTAADIGAMAGGMLAMRSPPAGFVRFLAERSNGNPFFIAEYLRSAVSERVLARDRSGRWTLSGQDVGGAPDYESLPLPGSLRQLIDLRLGKLTAADRRVVDLAALMGRHLDSTVLGRAAGLSDAAMTEVADELVSRQIVEPAEGEGYRFVHDKIREIADAGIPADTRRALHRQLAQAIEAVYPAGEARDDHRADLGRHWALAGEPALAVPHLRAAAERAERFQSVADAIGLYQAALDAVAGLRARGDDDGRWRREAVTLNERLGDALALQNRHADARAAFARTATDATDDRVTLARLHRKAGKTYEIEHDHDAALRTYRDGEIALGDQDALDAAGRQEWIQIVLNRVWVYYWLDRPGDIDTALESVRPFVEGDPVPTQRYHYFMALVNRNHRRYRYRVPGETLVFARRMLEAAQESAGAAEIAFAHFILGFALLFAGELEEAEAVLFEAAQGCRRIGDAAGETRAVAYLAVLHRRRGRVEQTAAVAETLLAIAKARRMRDYQGVALAALGWAAWRRGEAAAADRLCASALETWAGLSFAYPFQWTAGLVALALARDRAPDAEILALARRLHEPPQCHLPDPIHDALGRALAADDAASAREALAAAVDAARELGFL